MVNGLKLYKKNVFTKKYKECRRKKFQNREKLPKFRTGNTGRHNDLLYKHIHI